MAKKRIIPLREEKHIRTKLALLNEIASGLKNQTFRDINIKEVCQRVLVSEPTFYNYYPRKRDVFIYFIRLWKIDLSWHLQRLSKDLSFREVVDAVFDFYAKLHSENPRLFNEMTTALLQEGQRDFIIELSFAEKYLAFPGRKGMVPLSSTSFETDMIKWINKAKEQGVLKETIDSEMLLMNIMSICMSVWAQTESIVKKRPIKEYYTELFNILWEGVAK